MKRFIVGLFAMMMMGAVIAQPSGRRPEMSKDDMLAGVMERIDQEMALSDEKKQEVMNIYASFLDEMEDFRNEAREQREKRQDQKREMVIARNTELKDVLSEEEFMILMALHEEGRKRRGLHKK